MGRPRVTLTRNSRLLMMIRRQIQIFFLNNNISNNVIKISLGPKNTNNGANIQKIIPLSQNTNIIPTTRNRTLRRFIYEGRTYTNRLLRNIRAFSVPMLTRVFRVNINRPRFVTLVSMKDALRTRRTNNRRLNKRKQIVTPTKYDPKLVIIIPRRTVPNFTIRTNLPIARGFLRLRGVMTLDNPLTRKSIPGTSIVG